MGQQVLHLIHSCYKVSDLIIFDDYYESEDSKSYPFEYLDPAFEDYSFLVCLGYHHLPKKKEIINDLKSSGRALLTIIHPTAHISDLSTIEDGVVIYPMCNIDMNVHIESGCILHNSVVVSHDSKLGACNYLSPGVIISGNVAIGQSNFMGSGTILSNDLTIGDNCQLGIGSIVTEDLPDNAVVIGNPLKHLSNRLKLT